MPMQLAGQDAGLSLAAGYQQCVLDRSSGSLGQRLVSFLSLIPLFRLALYAALQGTSVTCRFQIGQLTLKA